VEARARCIVNAGWSWGCVSAIDSNGRTIWIVNAHRDDGRRFVVHSDEILTAFVELEREVLTVTCAFWDVSAYHSRPNQQRIGDEIDAAFIFARANFVNVSGFHCDERGLFWERNVLTDTQ
jgi:hypothetical protein